MDRQIKLSLELQIMEIESIMRFFFVSGRLFGREKKSQLPNDRDPGGCPTGGRLVVRYTLWLDSAASKRRSGGLDGVHCDGGDRAGDGKE